MNKHISMKYAVVLVPAFVMGISSASAEDKNCDCPCSSVEAGVSAEMNHGKQGAEAAAKASERANTARKAQAEREARASREAKVAEKASREAKVADKAAEKASREAKTASKAADKAADKASASARTSAEATASANESHYLASKPADDYFSSNLIGHDVMNRRDNKVVGTVSELLIDENGQIGAVIIRTGGVLGMGKKDLAIAWNKVERKLDGENITLSIDVSDVSLGEAPTFARK